MIIGASLFRAVFKVTGMGIVAKDGILSKAK